MRMATVPGSEMCGCFEIPSCPVPDEMTQWRKRRGSGSHLRHDGSSVVIATGWERRPDGKSQHEGYQHPRPRKLSSEEQAAVRRAAADGAYLCLLARELGMSHKTFRAICQ
jgi:hypothetical protein